MLTRDKNTMSVRQKLSQLSHNNDIAHKLCLLTKTDILAKNLLHKRTYIQYQKSRPVHLHSPAFHIKESPVQSFICQTGTVSSYQQLTYHKISSTIRTHV